MSGCDHIQAEQHYYLHYRGIDEENPKPPSSEVYRAYYPQHAESDRSHQVDMLVNRVLEVVDLVIVQESCQDEERVTRQWR